MEILLEPTAKQMAHGRLSKMVVEVPDSSCFTRSITTCSYSINIMKAQRRCNIKAFQEWYEHVGPEVASPQGGKVSKMAKRLCLVDDLKMLKITMSNTSSRNKLNPRSQ
ncbi:hypothetical protein Tco_1371285 [Tanacetum coccineum]